MKLLLDMYRSAPKEQRDKVQLMAAEKKSKSEVNDRAKATDTHTHQAVSSQSMQNIHRGLGIRVSQLNDAHWPHF